MRAIGIGSLLLLVLFGLAANPGTAAEAAFEKPPVLRAADLLPAERRAGDGYRIADQVRTDGFLLNFVIDSDYGTFEARGPGMLDIRLREIAALRELDAMSKTDVFVEALKTETTKKKIAIQHAIEEPKETLAGLPEGVGRFFGRAKRAATTGTQTIKDKREAQAASGESIGMEETQELAGQAARVTADAFGLDEARRKLAKELAVDPYTTNSVLSAKLDEMAKAAFAGAIGVRVAASYVPGSTLVSTTQTAAQWVWDTPPGDLRVAIDQGLQKIGVPQDVIDQLLRHPAYSLTLQATLYATLESIPEIDGRVALVSWALTARSEDEARFIVLATRMLARYHREIEPVASVEVLGPLAAHTADGALVVIGPADYLAWTAPIAGFISRESRAARDRSIWLSGETSPLCREQITAAGWKLHERVLVTRLQPD